MALKTMAGIGCLVGCGVSQNLNSLEDIEKCLLYRNLLSNVLQDFCKVFFLISLFLAGYFCGHGCTVYYGQRRLRRCLLLLTNNLNLDIVYQKG